MIRYFIAILLAACLPLALAAGVSTDVVWSDDFEGPAGSAPDSSKWVFDLGATGWGNDELQEYTSSRQNSFLDGKGHLVIRAIKGPGNSYTSSRLKTKGTFMPKFGRIEGRMRLPEGQGIWPAFWMLCEHYPEQGWPQCGEIDIMENIGKEPGTVHATLHGPGYSGASGIGAKFELPAGKRFADDFHVYAVEWREDDIRFFVDGKQYHQVQRQDLKAGQEWVFNRPFFILLNLAVGGRWPGYPDHSTRFPQQLVVDWVRVYK